MTTTPQVKGLKGSGRPMIWKCTEEGKASLLPRPVLDSAMEEKIIVGSPHSQKNEAQHLGKSIWLFKLQLLMVLLPLHFWQLHHFIWPSKRNMRVGCRWPLSSGSSLSFPNSLRLSVFPSLFCSCKFYFLALSIIHKDYFSLNSTEKAGYLYSSGSGGDERINEAWGCVLNNFVISIIDVIVSNNKEKLFLLQGGEGKKRLRKKKEVRGILHLKFAA